MMRNTILALAVVMTAAVGGTRACSKPAESMSIKEPQVCGGYGEWRNVGEDDLKVFAEATSKAQDRLKPYILTPHSVSTQVVAGLNYRFLCTYKNSDDGSAGECQVTIYQPLSGDPEVSDFNLLGPTE